MTTLFRFRHKELGEHTHVRVFAGRGAFQLGKCGDLVFTNGEWVDLQRELRRLPGSSISILPDDGGNVT